jgi:hypothetical protein
MGEIAEVAYDAGALLLCGLAAMRIATRKGAVHRVPWFLAGLGFGPLGVLVAAIHSGPEVPPEIVSWGSPVVAADGSDAPSA